MNWCHVPLSIFGAVLFAQVITATTQRGVITGVSSQASEVRQISGQPFVANLYLPRLRRPYAGVVVVGGSGGGIGWQDYWGEILARHGFAALALAYFGMEGLPMDLDQIPLEYFVGAIEYLRRQPEIDRNRIGVLGVSRGGELALLLASHTPQIRAVVAFVPGSVVFQSAVSMEAGQNPRSSWTLRGRPLPFVPVRAGDPTEPLVNEFRRALSDRHHVTNAAIPVERIRGPILLLSGKEDTTWPSTQMSEMIVARLRERRFRYSYEHIAYDGAGHMIHQVRADAVKRGGTEEGNRIAQQDAQERTVAFLNRTLDVTNRQ